MDPIDLTQDVRFCHSTWIGAGKVFSDSLPDGVNDKKQEIFAIPNHFRAQLPTATALVHEFISHPLPLQSSGLSFHQTNGWFSDDAALTPPNILLNRPIPPADVLKNLNEAAGQMWFDGAVSIVDPRFNDGTERFPLWILTLWNEVATMIQHQKQWSLSVRWLGLVAHHKDIVAQAKNLVGMLSWNGPLGPGGKTTLELASFLGVSWLSDTQVDMMVEVLQSRLVTEEYTEHTLVEPLAFSLELRNIGKGWKALEASPYLSRLASQIQDGVTAIWFPINLSNVHWIAGKVDFESHTFEFGEWAMTASSRTRINLIDA